MKTLLKSIALDETSYNVALLHQTLEVLGFSIAREEVEQRTAGKDTREKVRALQHEWRVPMEDYTLVNDATIAAIADALEQRELTEAKDSFTVSGTVRLQDGTIRKQQRLWAFDLDLRGVAIYRTVMTPAEIEKNGGFEFLGETMSDNQGNYSLTFYDWQYQHAERKKADVVMYAIEGDYELRIIGHSRMVNSEDYSSTGFVQGLDVTVAQTDTRTEHKIVMDALNVFLSESQTTLRTIAVSQDQLSFTAGELDLNLTFINLAASAELLIVPGEGGRTHELLYGIGRQDIRLEWTVLYRIRDEELRAAIAKSVDERIIEEVSEEDIASFLQKLHERAASHLLNQNATDPNSVNAMLSNALPLETQRLSFLSAVGSFAGSDFSEFWSTHLPEQPEFREHPELVSNLLLTQQLTRMTGNHQDLVTALQVERNLSSIHELFELDEEEWLAIVRRTGIPDFWQGTPDEEEQKIREYADLMQSLLNTTFPTQRIGKMVERNQIPIENGEVTEGIRRFLSATAHFDFATSRIHDFEEQIQATGPHHLAVKRELMKLQRVFQVSTKPEAMTVLLERNLHSAHTIANIPLKSFIKTYGEQLGGEGEAVAIHQRASHISTRIELSAMHLREYSHGALPITAVGVSEQAEITTVLQNRLPNYSELFGSPDICECEHCRSVYSAAAYFVDLLRFLWRGEPNKIGKTPLDMLVARRPDLLHLPLTCENTNTLIPYIDLANEVMEHYTANDSLTNFEGYDTGEATVKELRANPQNFNLEAYRKLKNAKYPFTLPFHQPLDVIRTYGNHLGVSRYAVMKAINPLPSTATANAIASESLHISPELYKILTGAEFDGTLDTTPLYEYFGYTNAGDLDDMSGVPEFLKRSGVTYKDLVELIKTRFINPFQGTLDFLQKIFSYAPINADTIYARLQQVAAGTLDPANDADIMAALNTFNANHGTNITASEFAQWVIDHFGEFRQVITLFEPASRCDLDTTRLRTIASIYEGGATSGISDTSWSNIHRFIRLSWKLGWMIHETDLMLAALGENDITPDAISKLEAVSLMKTATKLPLNQLAVLWGNIDTYGDKSLYKTLFLNKAAQQIDEAFQADAFGAYLEDPTEVIAAHLPAIFAAFRMSQEDLDAIIKVARVIDGGNVRPIDINTDILNLPNLSTIYRYVLFAKTLKLRVTELCKLIALFAALPFSRWNIQQEEFNDIAPGVTYEFYQLASAVKSAGFKTPVLEYIFFGTSPADAAIGLAKDKVLKTAIAIRKSFSDIEQNHPEPAALPLTPEIITAKLSLTFHPAIVSRFIGILEGTASFETTTDSNLNVTVPTPLSTKYTYVKGSGRLICVGVMSDAERAALKVLPNINTHFEDAVERLYDAPEIFISTHFSGIFDDLIEANRKLLDHPAQPFPATLDEKLTYVYEHFIPILKSTLRRDAMTQRLAALIGLSDEATSVLIAGEVSTLITDLSIEGFSATYFSDPNWITNSLQREDAVIDFAWGMASPSPSLPADNFSVRWEAYLAPPASGLYTLVVDVEEADEDFKLYLDGTLILEKPVNDPITSWEIETALNASQMHLIRLSYADRTQNAGVRLRWKKAMTALDIVPASVVYPSGILDWFVSLATVYHRAAKFINGFKLSETELNHFITFAADFGNINFQALDAGDWKRIYDYATLRNAVPQAQALLTDVFALANTLVPAPSVNDLTEMLFLATAWDKASLQFLVNSHFSLLVGDFKNEIALNRLRAVMHIAVKTKLSTTTIAVWGDDEKDFDILNDAARLLRNTVRSRYEEEVWLDIAADLSDTLRKNQQQALIGYLLTRPALQAWGAKDANGLFEYFLIDVQMGACMDTSRIGEAYAAVQMFVNRCLLNLESDMTNGVEKGVSPGAIDKDRWEWMDKYRLWGANRQVFLYPENYLEPEWRNDRSEFFKDLESYLVQNDITDRSVEQAFRDYLTSLNEVANLEVCGIHRENHDNGLLKHLDVIGRTHHAPYKFFHRRWDEYGKWSAWSSVKLDIRNVEDGDHSGVHLNIVGWKNRLFLFWPEFIEVTQPKNNGDKSIENLSADKVSTLAPDIYWEIRLAWSEYVDGNWNPKQLSKEFLKLKVDDKLTPTQSSIRWIYTIGAQQRLELIAHCKSGEDWFELGAFHLSDITSKVEISRSTRTRINGWKKYELFFMNYVKTGKLLLANDLYLRADVKHQLLVTPTFPDYMPRLIDPFFFSDNRRTYFVRPVDITVITQIAQANQHPPFLADLVFNNQFQSDDESPRASRVEVRSMEAIRPEFSGGGMMLRSTNDTLSVASTATVSRCYNTSLRYTQRAFDGNVLATQLTGTGLWTGVRDDKGLEFHTFYHPFSGEYVRNLNRRGLSCLMESDTGIASDNGSTFQNTYLPNFSNGFVQKPSDFPTRTYYKQNVCFDVHGANSLYNWELFFHAPLYIATRLSKNGKYKEAMQWFHYIFDPTTDEMPAAGQSEVSRYWKVLPFKNTPASDLEDWFRSLSPNADPAKENAIIGEWSDHPFDPHRVASNRPLAYMLNVVMKYVENLIAWGDSLFRQDTRESVNEALQIYVIARNVLGPQPQSVPQRGEIKAETYYSLKDKLDDFSNALVELENLFPYSSQTTASSSSAGTNLLGIGSALYFCIPFNEKLLDYWRTAEDRLFKIHNCMNIEGIVRELALFAPPIDPAALIQAASQGLSLGNILDDLSSPPPIYRFSFLIQKAKEFCADVKALGNELLAAIEKKEVEGLSLLRASHETQMLELMTAIRERQVLDAKAKKENLLKARDAVLFRLQHYVDLLGNEAVTVPGPPTISPTLTADSQLPADTNIATIPVDVDVSLADSGETGVKLIPREKAELEKSAKSMVKQQQATNMEGIAGLMSFIPNFTAQFKPFGVGGSIGFGGSNLAGGISGFAKIPQLDANKLTFEATLASKMASYVRRDEENTYQANSAAKEIPPLDKQIIAADIGIQIAQKELERHQREIENAKEVELFLRGKFTNQELYQWMKEQLFAVYKQSYNLAYDMAKKAEKAYQYEMGMETTSFIQYGYWEDSKKGLVSCNKLQLALLQLEKSYLEVNRRKLELTRDISLSRLNPLALIQLRETGRCYVSVPEELFDLDFRGHYSRHIQSVRISIPCVVGPYTSVSCSLSLLNNSVRTKTTMNSNNLYEHENDDGLLIDDPRFRTNRAPVTSIATSTAQNDSGMFEFNFRDERYLPFECAGAISEWHIELSTEKALRQFDYATISDVILHLDYTAREGDSAFKTAATEYIRDRFLSPADSAPLMQMFSMRHEFPTEWHRFLNPPATSTEHLLDFTLGQQRFPYFTQEWDVIVTKLEVIARCVQPVNYSAVLSYNDHAVTTTPSPLETNDAYGDLRAATIDITALDLNITEPMTLEIQPPEVEDVYLVVHYKLTLASA